MSTAGNIWFDNKWFIMVLGPKQGKSLAHCCDPDLRKWKLTEWDTASQSWYCPECDVTPSDGIHGVCQGMGILTVRNKPR